MSSTPRIKSFPGGELIINLRLERTTKLVSSTAQQALHSRVETIVYDKVAAAHAESIASTEPKPAAMASQSATCDFSLHFDDGLTQITVMASLVVQKSYSRIKLHQILTTGLAELYKLVEIYPEIVNDPQYTLTDEEVFLAQVSDDACGYDTPNLPPIGGTEQEYFLLGNPNAGRNNNRKGIGFDALNYKDDGTHHTSFVSNSARIYPSLPSVDPDIRAAANEYRARKSRDPVHGPMMKWFNSEGINFNLDEEDPTQSPDDIPNI